MRRDLQTRAIVVAAALLATAGGVTFAALAPVVLAYTTYCSPNWYGQAVSGTGQNAGDQMTINMPANYYAPTGVTSDEAAWLENFSIYGQQDSGVELGYFTGTWPYDSNLNYYTTVPLSYITENSGNTGNDGGILSYTAIPASTQESFQISENGSQVQAPNFAADLNYGVSGAGPGRTDFSQGEVAAPGGAASGNNGGAWMGGNNGGGTTAWGYYQPTTSSGFTAWGSFSMCQVSPYWIYQKASNSWKNGGS